MSKFLLTDWEINGYDDSDFMCSYYDDVTNTIGFHMYGTTRCAAPTNIGFNADGSSTVVVDGDTLVLPNSMVVEKARLVLEENIFQRLTKADKRLVDEPDVEDLSKGLRVRLTANARMQMRATEPCNKCNGSGKWINPRRETDVRNCFACGGSGQHKGAKVKNEAGKQVYETLPAGLSGSVVDWNSFGQFYASGYNKPNRDNTTVQFLTNDNKVVRASLNKLRLDRDYQSPESLRKRAMELSYGYQFSALYPRFAWDTHNFAASVAKAAAPIHDS